VLLSSFESFNPALVRHVLRRYDAAVGGTQVLPALVPGALRTTIALTRAADETRSVGGRDVTFHRWRLEQQGRPMSVWAEADDRVVMIELGSTFVRKGYESLMPVTEDPDPLVSRAEHEVVIDDEVVTPMRDGTELRADVYRPTGAGPWPTVVVRTPYKKEVEELRGRYFARRGYSVVVQDVRGRFASPGKWTPMNNEKQDGYDTIEWAARQPWSTGKVGMVGPSYLGWVQWLAAVERPPHLVTIIPNVAPPDPFYNIPYEHGVMHTFGSLWWLGVVAIGATADPTGQMMRQVTSKPYGELLRTLPVADLDRAVLGGQSRHWREWVAHSSHDDYWAGASYLDELSQSQYRRGQPHGDGIRAGHADHPPLQAVPFVRAPAAGGQPAVTPRPRDRRSPAAARPGQGGGQASLAGPGPPRPRFRCGRATSTPAGITRRRPSTCRPCRRSITPSSIRRT
jgi:hypothetical protein